MTQDIILPRTQAEPDPDAGTARSRTEFAHIAYNLLDHEADRVGEIARKYQLRWIRESAGILSDPRLGTKTWEKLVEAAERIGQDVKEELADKLNLVAAWDSTPIYWGQPPLLEIMDKVEGDDIHRYGFDHEQKGHEVLKARDRGEDFLGQRERVNARRPT